MQDRYLDLPTAEALDRTRQALARPFLAIGPVLEVAFPAASTKRDLEHRMPPGVVPNGVLVLLAVGGDVRAHRPERWTSTLAFLEATVAQTRARVQFVLTQEPIRA